MNELTFYVFRNFGVYKSHADLIYFSQDYFNMINVIHTFKNTSTMNWPTCMCRVLSNDHARIFLKTNWKSHMYTHAHSVVQYLIVENAGYYIKMYKQIYTCGYKLIVGYYA